MCTGEASERIAGPSDVEVRGFLDERGQELQTATTVVCASKTLSRYSG